MPGESALTHPSNPDALSGMLGFRTVSVKELSAEDKQLLRDTVAKDTTDNELSFFLNVALAQELNPFLKEVWCIKYGGKLTIQTARDGYLKIAKRDPQFSTIQSAEVREGDHFTLDPVTGDVEHRFGSKRGSILGAYAIITRKDGKKVAKYVTFSEYQSGSEPWKKYPSAMICKCAETALCKQFANISGIDAEELMPRDAIDVDASPAKQEETQSLKNRLLEQIGACRTIEEFESFKNAIAPMVGKLFENEREEVFAAAKAKREELGVLDRQPETKTTSVPIDAEEVEEIQDQPEPEPETDDGEASEKGTEPADEDEGALDGDRHFQDVLATMRGFEKNKELIDYWLNEVANDELLNDQQRETLAEVYVRLKERNKGKSSPKAKSTFDNIREMSSKEAA